MNSGEFRVVQTISKETLLCMYGGQSQSVQGLISVISDDLTAWLSSEGSLFDYKPPYQNSFVTEIETMHSSGLKDLLKSAIQNHASLASLNFIEEDAEDEYSVSKDKSSPLSTRWIKKVKGKVLEHDNNLKKNFNFKIGKIHSYHYVSNHYVANLAAMNPARVNASWNEAKKLLWDLSVVRDYSFDLTQKELIVFMPEFDEVSYTDKQYKDAQDYLSLYEEEADKKEIVLIATSSPEKAAKRLLIAA